MLPHKRAPLSRLEVYHMDDLYPATVDETGKENLSAPRLIAERLVLRELSDVLHDPIEAACGGFISIDDLYYSIHFTNAEAGEKMRGLADTVQCDGAPSYFEGNKQNAWRFMWVYTMGDSTVRLGIGWNETNGKISMNKGFLQFNPNKTGDCVQIVQLMRKVGRFSKSVELRRYDVAIDIPCSRDSCRMSKDNRGYEYVDHGRGITEYLGTRNSPGRVKLYDKTRQAGLRGNWTRLEITAGGEWDADRIMQAIPSVYAWNDAGCDGETRNWVRAFGLMAAEYLDQVGGTLEPFMRLLGKKAARKVAEYLASPRVTVERVEVEAVMKRAQEWGKHFGV